MQAIVVVYRLSSVMKTMQIFNQLLYLKRCFKHHRNMFIINNSKKNYLTGKYNPNFPLLNCAVRVAVGRY